MTTNIIYWEALLDNAYYLPQSSKKEFFVYVTLKGNKAPKQDKRPPLNIALVIDRSGSMEGPKLDYTKKAVDFVIDNVESTDSLAIVQYDDKVDVVSSNALVKDKKQLHQKVKQIKSGGSTNLSGGMLEGYSQVKGGVANSLADQMLGFLKNSTKNSREGCVNRVLLLSDGLANAGVTDLAQLQMIAQKKFREEQIGLSTFGVGADFNEELMMNLAEYGGANYYFIDKPDNIPQIFAKELSGLLAIIAQNSHLTINFNGEYAQCTKVYGYPATISGGKVAINFNDIFSEEEKAVLLRFEIVKPFVTNFPIDVELQYDDVVVKLEKIKETKTLDLQLTQDERSLKNGINATVLEQVALFVSNDLFEVALKEADKRNFDAARKTLNEIKGYLDTHFQLFTASEELQKQYKIIVDYLNNLTSMEAMDSGEYAISQKMSKMSNYDSRKKR